MKKRLSFLFSSGLFFILLFMVFRLVFVAYQWQLSKELDVQEVLFAFISGLRHDLSLMAYVLIISGIVLCFSFFVKASKLIVFFNVFYTSICLLIMSILVPNLELYRNWGFHFDSTVLAYLKTPKEAAASTLLTTYIGLFIIFIVIFSLSYVCIRRYVTSKLKNVGTLDYKYLPILLFVSAFMIIPMRGGLGIAPMNVGFVYFSNKVFANHIAVNPIWNFAYSMKTYKENSKTYSFMSKQKLDSVIAKLKNKKNSTKQYLNISKPNVIIVMLESFTSKAVGCLGANYGATPYLDKLSEEGILFTNFYSIGDRSKIGILGLLSGYPSLPRRSVISYTRKTLTIPSLCKQFKKKDYSSTFYYGGDVRFANMNSYIMNTGFDNIISMDDFSSDLYNSKWGVHDEYMFNYLLKDIKKSKKPFFKVLFTLSSHEPFDVPMDTKIKGDTEDQRFLNSICYTDKCLGNFIGELKKTDKWDNTLVIFIADHGTRYINNSVPSDFVKYKIPMIWIGGALNKKGVRIDKIACQPDLSNTLLNQLDMDDSEFIMGKDALNDTQKGYAYFCYNNGFGYIDAKHRSVYDLTANRYIHREGNDADGENWKALLQYLNKDFNLR